MVTPFILPTARVKTLSTEQKVEHFKAEVVPIFREYYEFTFDGWWRDKLNSDERLRDIVHNAPQVEDSLKQDHINLGLGKILNDFPHIEPGFRARAPRLDVEVANSIVSFKQRFPDFNDDIEAFVIHSL